MEDLDNETIEELKAKAIERGGDEVDDITTNEIDEELKDPEPPTIIEEPSPQEVKKPKRQRSEKQKAAFEKARQKRAENLKIKKQIEAEKKQKKQEEKEQVKIEVKKRLQKKEQPVLETALHNPTRPKDIQRFPNDLYDSPEQPFQRVVNNYYYYGATPSGAMQYQNPAPEVQYAQQYYEPGSVAYGDPTLREPEKPRRGRPKKVKPPPEPETESESESEEEIVYSDPEEPQSYKELQNYVEEEQFKPAPKQNNGLKFRFA